MMSVYRFELDVLATTNEYVKSIQSSLLGVGWTPAFWNICYPGASRDFLIDTRNLSIGLVLALYVTLENSTSAISTATKTRPDL